VSMSKARRERNAAIHEAGHAAASYFLRHKIRYVTIIPKSGSLGYTSRAPMKFVHRGVFDDSPRGVDRAEKYIVICFSGPFASRKLAPRSMWAVGGFDRC
jgi:hypothetical protein